MKSLMKISGICVLAMALIAAAPIPIGNKNKLPEEIPAPEGSFIVIKSKSFELIKTKYESFLKNAFTKEDAEKYIKKTTETDLNFVLNPFQWKGITKDSDQYLVIKDFEGRNGLSVYLHFTLDDADAFENSFFNKEKMTKEEPVEGIKVYSNNDTKYYLASNKKNMVMTVDLEYAKNFKNAAEMKMTKTKELGEVAEAFFASDISMFVNIEAIREKYQDQVNQARGVLPIVINQQKQAGVSKRQAEQTMAMLNGLLQMFDDGKGFIVCSQVEPEGLTMRLGMSFLADTVCSKLTSQEKPGKMEAFNQLPEGQFGYFGISLRPDSWTTYTKIYREFCSEDDTTDEKFKVWNDLVAKNSQIFAFYEMDRSGVSVSKNQHAELVVADLLKAVKESEEITFQNIPVKGKIAIKEKDQTFNEIAMHKLSIEMDFEKMAERSPENVREIQVETIKKLMPQNLNLWAGAKGDQLIYVTAKDWETAKVQLEKFMSKEKTISKNESLQIARKSLSAETNVLLVFDTVKMINFIGTYTASLIGLVPGAPINVNKKAKVVEHAPLFGGSSITFKGNGASLDYFIPAKTFGLAKEAAKPFTEKD